MNIRILLALQLLTCFQLTAQNTHKRDSLMTVLKGKLSHKQTIETYIELGNVYQFNLPDSAKWYFQEALAGAKQINENHLVARSLMGLGNYHTFKCEYSDAIELYNKAVSLSMQLGDKAKIAAGYANIGIIYGNQAKYDTTLIYFEKSLKYFEEIRDSSGMARCYNNLGLVYNYMSNFDDAINEYLKAIDLDEKKHNMPNLAQDYNNIGSAFYDKGDYAKALDYYFKALTIREELNDRSGMAQSYNNIATVHSDMHDIAKALDYHNKSLAIKIEIGDPRGIASTYNNLGTLHWQIQDYEKALKFFNKSLSIRQSINDLDGICQSNGNIASTYAEMGRNAEAIPYFLNNIKIYEAIGKRENLSMSYQNLAISYLKTQNNKKAITYATKGLALAEEVGSIKLQMSGHQLLSSIYEKLPDYQKALSFNKRYKVLSDSLYRVESRDQLNNLETKYQTHKKQQEIEKQQLVIEKQEIDNRRQRNQRNFFIAGSLLLAILALAIFRSYQQKKQSNALITEKNVLLEQANEEIAAQRDLVVEQKEHIETIHEELTSSIRYARRIQGAVLPTSNLMSELLGNHFILFKPKDIVSGDFYWATKVKHLLIFCVADCTGHGVPGAFMSMLGVSFLNDIVHKEHITSANEVLNHLRDSIIGALNQLGDSSEQKDGMDMGLCVIDTQKKLMQFAGGYNPCWVVPNAEFTEKRVIEPKMEVECTEECTLIQLKPDKMPIAIHKHMVPFTSHLLQLYPGDQVYLMSDGYQDQFGGPQCRKFMVKNLRELVVRNAHLPMIEQCELLDKNLEEWKNETEQVDDITILGIKI